VDVVLLLARLLGLLAIVLIIYVLPIALVLVCTIRLIFGFGARKWLALGMVFSMPQSFLLFATTIRPFTFTMNNAGLYGGVGLTLGAVGFWFMGTIKSRGKMYWLEGVVLCLTSIFWLIYMMITTNWIVH